MFYKLNDNFILRGWDKLPYAIVNRKNKQVRFLSQTDMEVLKLCNGKIDFSLPLISEEMRGYAKKMAEIGFVSEVNEASEIQPEQEYRQYPARYIRTVHWSITGRCNYRCKHCYMSAPDAKFGELSHEVIMDMIEQLSACGVMNVSLTGGEALVRKDFMEIVDALLERDIRITTIYSNGRLVTEKLLLALDERGIHPEFNMSYDGEGWHDWLRGIDGAEKIVKKAFLLCKKYGFPTGAEMCIHHRNKHTLRQSVQNLAEWGCRSLKTNPISNVGAWAENGYGEGITKTELYETYTDYIPKFYEDGMPLNLQLGGFFAASPHEPNLYSVPLMKHCKNPDTMCMCGHARMVMYISAEGRALPCMALSGMDIQKEFPLITEIGLEKCLTDSRYMSMIDERLTAYMRHNPKCAECKYIMYCAGGCRAGGLESHPDDLLAPDEYACEIFQNGWLTKIREAVSKGNPTAKVDIMLEE